MRIKEAMDIFFSNKKNDPTFILTEETLKKTYRRLCKENHPDEKVQSHPGTDITNYPDDEFKKVQEAYCIIKTELIEVSYSYLWDTYTGKNSGFSTPPISKAPQEPSFYTYSNVYSRVDNVDRAITNIMCANIIIKRVIYKEKPTFEFPNDEYLIDFLLKFKDSNQKDLAETYQYLKTYMGTFVTNFHKEYATGAYDIYFGYRCEKYGLEEITRDFKILWYVKNKLDNQFHNSANIESIRERLQTLCQTIDDIKQKTFIEKSRILLLKYLLLQRELNVGLALKTTYQLLASLKLYIQDPKVVANNISIYEAYTLEDLSSVSKTLANWEKHIYRNEIKVVKDTDSNGQKK